MPTEKPKASPKPIKLDLPAFGDEVSYTGEPVQLPRLSVPLIRISYKEPDDEGYVAPKGEFIEYDPATKETKALGKKITIQILHHRQSLSAFKDLGNGQSESYFTPEVSMKKGVKAPLFYAKSDGNGNRTQQFLMEGELTKDGLRKDYQELRYQRSLYVLHEGKLKNLVVYGASFSGFIDFTKAIQGQSSADYTVELTTTKQKKGQVSYYPITFTAKDKSDKELLKPTLKQLNDWFDEYDRRMAKQRNERAEQAAVDRGDGPTKVEPDPNRMTISEQIKHDEEMDRKSLEQEMEEKLGI